MRVPKKENHPVVGDNLTRYYHYPLIRNFFLWRLTMALDLLGKKTFGSLLEIGFGSGVLLPELKIRARRLYGIDIHAHLCAVKKMLYKEGVNAHLANASLLNLPFRDASFDCVVSVATLEHITDLSHAAGEIKRVLKPAGIAVLGFPVENRLSDILLILTGSRKAYKKELKDIHPSSHRDIISQIRRDFGKVKIKKMPLFLPLDLALYCCCMVQK